MSIIETTLDVDRVRDAVAAGDPAAFAALLADDVVWTIVDQRTPPSAPAVLHGRDEIVAMIRDAVARGIVTHVTDGFTTGARGAFELTCTYPAGGKVVEHALVELRGGRIARWSGVQAWDE